MKPSLFLLVGGLSFALSCMALDSAIAASAANANPPAPYTSDKTLQTFTKTTHGGVQHVTTLLDSNNTEIQLIRRHLAELSTAFKNRDFSSSEKLHGADMPGLAQLKSAKADEIKIEYRPLANGAQLHFSSEYPRLVQALHEWFDAQAAGHAQGDNSAHGLHHAGSAE